GRARLAHDTGSSIGRSAPITLVSFSPDMLRRRGRAHHEGGRWGCRGMWTLMFGHHEDRTPTHGYAARPRWRRSPRAGGGSSSKIGMQVRFRGDGGKFLLGSNLTWFDPQRKSAHSQECVKAMADPQ